MEWAFCGPMQELDQGEMDVSHPRKTNLLATCISEQVLRNNLSLNIYLIFLQYLLHISSRYQSFEISCLENFDLEERQPLAVYLEHKPQPERRLHMQDILNGWGGKRSAEKQRGAWELFSINSTCIFFLHLLGETVRSHRCWCYGGLRESGH